ncbi:helix-turn-helix domain-containing protein [Brevibacterium ammoniilyticum]|uniref:helix-turn-helix domain-containing protein n=1 Tax=Brevibacterium ammoniilyticum TaxID=1046555 RepID=UPI0031DBDB46
MQTHERIPRNGLTIRELAARAGVDPRTVKRWTSDPRDVYLSRAEQRRERIRELRETGLSYRAIAAEVGCSIGTVHNALKDAPSA